MGDRKGKHMIALAPSALFREGAVQIKEKSDATETKQAEQPADTKVKAKDDKSAKSKVAPASTAKTKEAEEKKEAAATPAAASVKSSATKVATKVTGI